MLRSEVGRQRNRTVPSSGESPERVGDGTGQSTTKMGRTLRLRTLNLAQQSERRTFHSFTFKDLRMRKTDSLLLLRQALGPDVPSDQMQLPSGVVQVVRAPVQLLLQTLDFGLRGGEIKLWANGRRK